MNNINITSKEIGQINEEVALHYLIQKGLSLIASNLHSRGGEIDLIMKDREVIVFVEVKYRKSIKFGGAISTISYSKQKNLPNVQNFTCNKQV